MKKTVNLTVEKETKGTWRFTEVGEPENHIFGTLYVKKTALDGLKPTKLRVDAEIE